MIAKSFWPCAKDFEIRRHTTDRVIINWELFCFDSDNNHLSSVIRQLSVCIETSCWHWLLSSTQRSDTHERGFLKCRQLWERQEREAKITLTFGLTFEMRRRVSLSFPPGDQYTYIKRIIYLDFMIELCIGLIHKFRQSADRFSYLSLTWSVTVLW